MELPSAGRLRFAAWTPADLDDALALWGDPRVMRFLSARGPLARAEVEARLSREIASQRAHGFQYWRLVDGAGAFVGCCGLKRNEVGGEPVVELGFHLTAASWGRGYASEAARAVVAHAFERLALPTLHAGHHPENAASRHVLEKLGFRRIGAHLFPPTGLIHPWYQLTRDAVGSSA